MSISDVLFDGEHKSILYLENCGVASIGYVFVSLGKQLIETMPD